MSDRSFFVALALVFVSAFATAPNAQGAYRFKVESRLGYHLLNNRDLATHRHRLEVGYDKRLSRTWMFRGSVRATSEAAYAANPERFGQSAGRSNSSEFVVRDLYLEAKRSPWQLRVGNQQVVWGEAFGFYYADIINPKDLREMGLWDFESQRIPLPMVQFKYLGSSWALQGVYVPSPSFHQMPSQGTDFFPSGYALGDVTIAEDGAPSFSFSNAEFGTRLSKQLGSFDLSTFAFSYFDRMPNYEASVVSLQPLSIRLKPLHRRIFTAGLTGTLDFSSFLFRWEALYTPTRWFDYLANGTIATNSSPELTYVLGADYTGLGSWYCGIQFSQTKRVKSYAGALTAENPALLSLHLNGSLWKDLSLDTTWSYMISDRGLLGQFRLIQPLSRAVEFQLGADALLGPSTSQFGQYREASRAMLILKAYFGGA